LLPLGWVEVRLTPNGEDDWLAGKREALKSKKPAPAAIQPSASVGTTGKPSAPVTAKTPSAPAPKNPSKALVLEFHDIPNIGDRFKGKVFDQEGKALELFIPGLDDTIAYAHISPENNGSSKRYQEGDIVVCEVIGLKKTGNIWKVECRRIS